MGIGDWGLGIGRGYGQEPVQPRFQGTGLRQVPGIPDGRKSLHQPPALLPGSC